MSFSGADSTSPYGRPTYSWDFGANADPATSDAEMPFCIYSKPGTKTVSLTVTDEDTGLSHSDEVTITVIDVGVTVTGAPRVVAAEIGSKRVNFEGTVSNAPEGADLSYSWNFGDGAIFLRSIN